MVTPNKEEIYKKATELWIKDQYRNGSPELAQSNPEYSELLENGYISEAQSMLMMSNPYKIVIERKGEKSIKDSKLLFDFEELLRSGCFVSGISGSGKSDLAMTIVDRLIEKGIVCYVIDPSEAWIEASNIEKAYHIEYPSQNVNIESESIIFDTSRLYVNEQRRFIEGFVEKLYQFQINQPKALRKWRIVVIEESQLVYPNGSFRSNKRSSSLQLISVGRNFRLRFIAITPFSANIDKYLIKMCAQRFFGSTSELNDLKYLKGFLGERVYELTKLDCGQFIYHFPKKRKVERISIKPHTRNRKLKTLPTSKAVFPKLEHEKKDFNGSAISSVLTAMIFLIALIVAVSSRGF